jgi:hypothetical protein
MNTKQQAEWLLAKVNRNQAKIAEAKDTNKTFGLDELINSDAEKLNELGFKVAYNEAQNRFHLVIKTKD